MKKGFVFIETLTVLTVLVTVLLSLFLTYETVTTNMLKREYYDNTSDLFKTNIIRSKIKRESLLVETGTVIKINKTNCSSFMNGLCEDLLEDLNVESIFINLVKISEIRDNEFKNTFKDYIKTIEVSNSDELGTKTEVYNRMIIVNYNYNNHNYYASLNI